MEHDPELDKAWHLHSREEPPAALDRAILAAAHRAVESGPHQLAPQATRPQRWWMPLAAAAAIGVVALGIVQLAPQEQAIDATTAPSAVAPVPQRRAQEESKAPPAPAEATPQADLLQKKEKAAEPVAQPSAPPNAPAPARVAAPPATAPPPAAPAPPARDNKLGADKAPEPFPAAPMAQKTEADAGKAVRPEEKRDAALAGNAAKPAPPPPPAAAAAEPMADARKDMSSERQLAAPAQAPASGGVTARMREGVRAQAESSGAAGAVAPMAKSVAADDEARARARDPDAWIVRIRKLRDEGHTADALRELREFRALVPDPERRLPADLRDWKP